MISEVVAPFERVDAKSWRDASDTPLMVELPSGSFIMGENEGDKFANDTERPAHRVIIPPGTSIGSYPVTVREYRHFAPRHAPSEQHDLPVVGVSWEEAGAYCAWLSRMTERNYRLPSEAEWEYACRANSRTPFTWGNEITPADANYLYDEDGTVIGVGRRVAIGNYQPNAFGLHDFHGNVCEWVADSWHPNYEGAPDDGTVRVKSGDRRKVVRGGAWDYLPRLLRSPWRDWNFADEKRDNLGFRVATSSSSKP
jgi:formylglycine-generating enzyme required for sulfatase activity